SKVFLIVDYELGKQTINGINVIEKTSMYDRHILVTNQYLCDMRNFNEKAQFLKMFPKSYLNDIPLLVI
ncbi:MAG: hypothetical protein LBS29_03315, partial [Endomicrobium sp.]|nr:hypothetical protein [Endomicrobium sp.]